MKIILFGASGTIGSAVEAELKSRHEIIRIGRTSGDRQADITDMAAIERILVEVGPVDALVATTGKVHVGPVDGLTPDLVSVGLKDKLMGQVNLILAGQKYLKDGGSITVTSGIVSDQPVRLLANASLVNGGLEAFVRAAAIELPRGLRVNSVSPSVVLESMEKFAPVFRGFEAVPAKRVALAYSRSVEGNQTGQVYRVW